MTDTTLTTLKVEARRQQILDAACACARRSGFHGASMAEIAQAADLSVGQIYRYFDNKEAIIAAIVRQDVAETREKFASLGAAGGNLSSQLDSKCSQAVCKHYDPERAALKLEVMAEAARNPRVAAMVREADAEERQMSIEVLRGVCPPNCSPEELAARAEVIAMLFDGMTMRSVSNPAGGRDAIAAAVRSMLNHVLEMPPATQSPAARSD